jgi:hypothetical protein
MNFGNNGYEFIIESSNENNAQKAFDLFINKRFHL